MNVATISAELHVSKRTVYTWVSEFRRGKRLPSRKSGRPKKTTPRSNRLLCRLAMNHPLLSATQLCQRWRERVSLNTVYRRLQSEGIRRQRRALVPFLSPANIASRLQWCMTRTLWREIWNRVIFTDESRFQRFGNDGRVRVGRRRGEEEAAQRNVSCRLQAGGGSIHV